MKKKIIITLVLLMLLSAGPLFASNFAAGIIVGDPTGISLLFVDRIALGAAWSFYNHFHIHADIIILNPVFIDPVTWYFGLGGKLKLFTEHSLKREESSTDMVALGFRVPIGLRFFPLDQLEIFGEVVPGMQLFPSTAFDIDLGIGLRYHF
jgi:hypothetical protein